jgi:hypothetical protein
MQESDSVIHSETLSSEQAGELLNIPRQRAEWECLATLSTAK